MLQCGGKEGCYQEFSTNGLFMKSFSFSLSTLLFLVTIVALALSTLFAWREVGVARTEWEHLRNDYGVIQVSDPGKTYVRRFVNLDYRILATAKNRYAESFRLVPADGAEYVLHLTETGDAYPTTAELTPTKSIPLPSWRPGAVVSCVVTRGETSPRVLISADSELVLDYESPQAWKPMTGTSESWFGVASGNPRAFDPAERIRLYWWQANPSNHGFLLWLEPKSQSVSQP